MGSNKTYAYSFQEWQRAYLTFPQWARNRFPTALHSCEAVELRGGGSQARSMVRGLHVSPPEKGMRHCGWRIVVLPIFP